MQSLQLKTEHLHFAGADLSLPSPSTFFGAGSLAAYLPSPSTAAFDYQASFGDFSAPLQLHDSSASSASTPEQSWSAGGSDRASSPATSHHSTPRGSPVLDKAVVVDGSRAAANPYEGAWACDTALQDPFSLMEHKPILDLDLGPSSQHSALPPASFNRGSFSSHTVVDHLEASVANHDAAMYGFAPSAHAQVDLQHQHVHQAQLGQRFDLPSPAASNASYGQYQLEQTPSPYHQHAAYAHPQHHQAEALFSQGAASAGFTAGQFAAAVSDQAAFAAAQQQQHYQAQQQQLQQPQQHLQFQAINGAIYAVAVPVSAPAPAAIETPHGTYYFVPNPGATAAPSPSPASSAPPAAQAAPVAVAQAQPAVVERKPSRVVEPSLSPAPAPSSQAKVTAPVVVPAASPDQEATFVLPTGATVPVSALPVAMGTQQKIRLPVGQGKKGSTKRRPAKKEQVRRFTCPHPGCGRAFARNFNMASHYKSHLGVREFQCPVCPKMFSRRHDRARHCAAVHDEHIDREGNHLDAELDGDLDLDHHDHDDGDEFDFELDVGVGASGSG
ncbi:hypothetical protein JCM9279_007728 [Rhodotorula babjevae]